MTTMSENKLPAWVEPASLDEAKVTILELGQSLHEHAYLIGKQLSWVKDKLGHGRFLPWVEKNLWFSQRTAQRFLHFAVECDKALTVLEYRPGKNDIMAHLPTTEAEAERAIKLARAWEIIAKSKNEPSAELIEAQKFALDFDAKREAFTSELPLLQARLEAANDIKELATLHKRATELCNQFVEMKIRAEYGLGKILSQIPKPELQGFLDFANLPKPHRDRLVAERISELL